jgi:hypothetical protein
VHGDRNYGQAYRDDSLQHSDYSAGIHISAPNYLGIVSGSDFEYGGNLMKAESVQSCTHFKDHIYIFCKLKEGSKQC